MKIRHLAFLAAVWSAFLAAPASAQQSTDIIRGRVTGPDTLPIAGARITATSYQGNIAKGAETDRNGRFQIIFVNGEGDYWIEVAKIGFNKRRFEIKKVGDEQVMLADARLASAVVSARRGQHHRRQSRARESQLRRHRRQWRRQTPHVELGRGAARSSGKPGGDGVDGRRHSAHSGHGRRRPTCSPPSDSAAIRTTRPSTDLARASARCRPTHKCASPSASFRPIRRAADSPARRSTCSPIPGSNFSFRGVSGYGHRSRSPVDGPGRRFVGTKVDDAAFRREPARPHPDWTRRSTTRRTSAQRTFADMLTLLNTSPLGLQSAGVASDSAARLIAILRRKGVPVSIDNGADAARDRQSNYQANIDFTPSSSGTGNSLTLGLFGGHVHVQPTGGGVQMLTRTPAQTGEADGWSTSASLLHSNYFWFGVLSQTTLGVASSSSNRRLRTSTIRPGTVRVASLLPDGTTSIKTLVVRRRRAAERRRESGGAAHEPAAVVQQRQQAYDQAHVERLARAQHVRRDRVARHVLVQLARRSRGRACRASYTRTLSSIHFPSDQLTAGVSIGDAWRPTSTVQVQYGVRADAQPLSLRGPTSTPRCATRSAFATTSCRTASTSARASACSGPTAPRRPIAYAPGAARPPLAVIHAVAGIFQNVGVGEPALGRRGADRVADLDANDRLRRPRGAGARIGARIRAIQRSDPDSVRRQQHRRACSRRRRRVCSAFDRAVRAAAVVAHGGRLVQSRCSTIASCSVFRACIPGT